MNPTTPKTGEKKKKKEFHFNIKPTFKIKKDRKKWG